MLSRSALLDFLMQSNLLAGAVSIPTLRWHGARLGPNTSHLRTSRKKVRGKRIKQLDKIEKVILCIKRFRWREVALLGFVFVVNLLDLATVDAQPTLGQDVLGHLV